MLFFIFSPSYHGNINPQPQPLPPFHPSNQPLESFCILHPSVFMLISIQEILYVNNIDSDVYSLCASCTCCLNQSLWYCIFVLVQIQAAMGWQKRQQVPLMWISMNFNINFVSFNVSVVKILSNFLWLCYYNFFFQNL